LEEGRPAEAAGQFAELIEQAPEEALGHANLALAELRLGAFEQAVRAAERARLLAPDDPEVLYIEAVVLAEVGRSPEAIDLWTRALRTDSLHLPSLWAVATRDSNRARPLLERLLGREPANLPARLTLTEAYLESGQPDAAVGHLEYLRQLLPRGDDEAKTELDRSLQAARRGDGEIGLTRLRTLHNLLRVDPMYGSGLRRLAAGQVESGVPLRRFRSVARSVDSADQVWRQVRFVATDSIAGADSPLLSDFDGDGDADVVVRDATGLTCVRNEGGSLLTLGSCARSGRSVGGRPVAAADLDGDARADLIVVTARGLEVLYRVDSLYADPTPVEGRAVPVSARGVVPLDADHDGDLDLLVGGAGSARLFRQTSAGAFEEVGSDAGLSALRDVREWSFGDLDRDGDVDLVALTSASVHVASNLRQGRYEVGPALEGVDAPSSVTVTDANGDGWFDILVSGEGGLVVSVNDTEGFGNLRAAVDAPGSISGSLLRMDFDNDGRDDVLVLPGAAGNLTTRLARGSGNGRFEFVPDFLEEGAASGRAAAADLDGDGDEDLLVENAAGIRVLSNEGGNLNHHMRVQLLGLADGSGKVNRLGLGSRIDVAAGDLQIARVVSGEVEHFGLGPRSEADVLRIEWTNGVPQNVIRPAVDALLVETQVLKGSCGFLYVWTGEGFEFVTDMMWKSALGMPLGIMAGETLYAPPDPSLEYVRIPPGMLLERDGVYDIRITEELWEVGYLDEVALFAVEHPDGTEVYVNEMFGAPDVPNHKLYTVRAPRSPEAAYTESGQDVQDLLAARDFRFVGGFDPGPYQGTTRLHDLVLTLDGASGVAARLFLAGWLFPTDASINVAMGQAGETLVVPPYLEVPDGRGGWRALDADIAFPTGKNKTVIVDLTEGVPSHDPRIRVRTTMEIYWDQAFYEIASDTPGDVAAGRRLAPVSAELGQRGFSRVYRRGGRYGPHWFDYSAVGKESPWRPLAGAYTREGDVVSLLLAADDQYVVFGPGDEMSIQFEALPPPAAG
ncbi:MAG: FG-GAP-like repeat-containing protein, partial [Gemmatimonadota bacterium]|nr:FG-GAP-like repeat-containing protein [Gemmatimonadota bacterium]